MSVYDGQSEMPKNSEQSQTTRFEQLVRKDLTLRKIFTDGIAHHLELLSANTRDAFGQEFDTQEPSNQFTCIVEAFNSGFEGYVVRTITTDNANVFYLSFTRNSDLYPKDRTRLNTAPGRRSREIIISIGRYALTPNETYDPSVVFSNKGLQIGAFTQDAWYDPKWGRINFERGSGFSVRMPENGGCFGIGTKWNGSLEYLSDLITGLDNIRTETLKRQLESSLRPTPPVAFNRNFR